MKQIKTNANTNAVVLGNGTLHFGDFDVEVKDVDLPTITYCTGEASEATFYHS